MNESFVDLALHAWDKILAKMSESPHVVFVCRCDEPKKHRLTFDGGSTGQYQLECCKACYSKEDKKHVIKEETIS